MTGGRSGPALVAVAHGSRDPAAQRTVEELLERVREQAGGVRVLGAYVQNAEPSLPAVLAEAGPGAVVVPLLLSRGYHVAVDIARAAEAAGAVAAPPLGPDPALCEAIADRLAEAGAPPSAPVVLAAAGSTDPDAQCDVRRQAELLAAHRHAPVLAAYATAAGPTVGEAIADLAGRTGEPVAVAAYLLAPGRFADAVRGASATWVAGRLGAHRAVARLVLDRYATAARATLISP